jgi:uncharacterized membrane-anchored protein YjiN (DUF445 family)
MVLDGTWTVIVSALLRQFKMNVVKRNDKVEHNVKKRVFICKYNALSVAENVEIRVGCNLQFVR